MLGCRREIAHAERQHAEPAIRVAQPLQIPGDSGPGHDLLECHPRFTETPVRLEDVAAAGLDAREPRLLVGPAEERRRPVQGREGTVVVTAETLQQAFGFEAVAHQLTLADAL